MLVNVWTHTQNDQRYRISTVYSAFWASQGFYGKQMRSCS